MVNYKSLFGIIPSMRGCLKGFNWLTKKKNDSLETIKHKVYDYWMV